MEVASFSEIEEEFIQRVHSVVWCSVATIDTHNRPRSRILHPIWEAAVGWIGTRRHSHKTKHLEHNPYLSLAYVADIAKPVYVDCIGEWVEHIEQRQRIWDLYKDAPPPLGYDPASIFKDIDNFGLLKLIPWRIEVTDFTSGTRVWHPQI